MDDLDDLGPIQRSNNANTFRSRAASTSVLVRQKQFSLPPSWLHFSPEERDMAFEYRTAHYPRRFYPEYPAASPLLKIPPAEEFRLRRIVAAGRVAPRLPALQAWPMMMTVTLLDQGLVPKRDSSAEQQDILKDTWQQM
jgi:hypothetical protein